MNTAAAHIRYIIPLLLVLLLSSCVQQEVPDNSKKLARVGDQFLTIDEAKSQIPRFIFNQDSAAALASYRKEWINRQVLLQEAERLGIEEKPEVQKKLRHMRENVLTQSLKDIVLGEYEKDLEITKKEAQNYYEVHKKQFVLNERYVRFRHLVTANLGASRQAKADLMRGKSWKQVVSEYGLRKEQSLQRSTQFWPISVALKDLPPMHQYLKIIGTTEISPIRLIDGQYHFVQLMEERAKGEHPDLDWLLDQIQDWLRLEKRRKHFSSYVKNLYLKAEANNEIESFNVLPNQNGNSQAIDTSQTTTHVK